MASASDDAAVKAPVAPAILLDERALDTPYDVARFLGVYHSSMIYTLYKSSPQERYRTFEIPKRTGGVRLISAPRGLLRDMQRKLAPLFTAAYDAHPSAHGFIPARSVVSNAKEHTGQRLVLNIDLEDFFPSINFGRVRGLLMARPFFMGAGAAAVIAQIVTHKNGLPQGAPTSPALSNFIAATLDRRLTRLAKENRLHYTRYADDITFSTNQPTFPPAVAFLDAGSGRTVPGEALERAVAAAGFTINQRKVRLQTRHQRQSVTGLVVNSAANVQRKRIRKIRAMIHAWEKFGLDAAGHEHFATHRKGGKTPDNPGRAYRNIVYGQLSFVKMVRGKEDPVFLKLCAKLIDLDPNPSRFIREMVFGAADFDVFISHASEDKETIARPIFEACARRGIKAFLDEAHIGWGESFTAKINTALGAARTVLCVISSVSVTKEWPLAEVNTALSMDVIGQKQVVPLMVGRPDLTKLPLIAGKDQLIWTGNAERVAAELEKVVRPPKPAGRSSRQGTSVPVTAPGSWSPPPQWGSSDPATVKAALQAAGAVKRKRGFFGLFGGKK
jgi:retron-type reverse transcriptase